MPSATYRTATQTRRGNRAGFADHDDFEGLPVRQWRHEYVSVAPPPERDTTQQNSIWDLELPYGMPKDWQLLAPHAQNLLRAARSGRIYKRPLPNDEDEDGLGAHGNSAGASSGDHHDRSGDKVDSDKKDDDGAEGVDGNSNSATNGAGQNNNAPTEAAIPGAMYVKVWKQMPRASEQPTTSHLAKRHKSTITLPSKNAPFTLLPQPLAVAAAPIAGVGATVVRASVRRIDAAGNAYDQEVILQEGEKVDGEIISTTVVPAAAVVGEGGVLMGAGGVTPVKKRPPPPKRKARRGGPGRGRGWGRGRLPMSANTRGVMAKEGSNVSEGVSVGDDATKTEGGSGTLATQDEAGDETRVDDEEGDDDEGEGEGEGEGDHEGDDDDDAEEIGAIGDSNGMQIDVEGEDAEDSPMPPAHPLAQTSFPPTKDEDVKAETVEDAPELKTATVPEAADSETKVEVAAPEIAPEALPEAITEPVAETQVVDTEEKLDETVTAVEKPSESTEAPTSDEADVVAADVDVVPDEPTVKESEQPLPAEKETTASKPEASEPAIPEVASTTEVEAEPPVVEDSEQAAEVETKSSETKENEEDDGLDVLGSLEASLNRQEEESKGV